MTRFYIAVVYNLLKFSKYTINQILPDLKNLHHDKEPFHLVTICG